MSKQKNDSATVTTIDDDVQAAPEPRATELKVADNHSVLTGDKVELTIYASEGVGGGDAVFVSHNGNGYQIPRGKPVIVPAEVAGIIEDAKTETTEFVNGKPVTRTANRFGFSIKAVK